MTAAASHALVLFSGGQDSATCLVQALTRFDRVETAGFDYGQRHRVELACRDVFRARLLRDFPQLGARLGPDHVLDAGVIRALGETAMTDARAIEMDASGLPTTFVPGRNLLFLTLAGALAVRRGIGTLIGGMCETDYSGYPDCRAETMAAQETTLRLGLAADIRIETPLMYLTKAQTWALADAIGGAAMIAAIIEDTHTCYLGERTQRHAWGYGCGTCPACELRARGWTEWQAGR
jgi:7-cyano-7-deazaguanine synthase